MKSVLITGGAGFIGSNLATKLIDQGCLVVCVDNFTLGTPKNVEHLMCSKQFKLYESDVADAEALKRIIERHQIELVFHLAANSDIQKSGITPSIDLNNTFFTTASVLESMRDNNVKQLFFASTSAVYGEKIDVKLVEDTGDLRPISYYGGAKLASEAMIHAYSYMNDMQATIFRFANVIGPRLTHGVIFDFIQKLKKNPKGLKILGDGTQRKPYIYVDDLVDAIINITEKSKAGVEVYNVGVDSDTIVTRIADIVCEGMGLKNVEYIYTGGDRGWKGDVPSFAYDLTKIHSTGWCAKYTSDEAVIETVRSVLDIKAI